MRKRTILKTPLAISIFLVALATGVTTPGVIIYVDDDATGANNGSSWINAYNHLQDALADANSTEKPVEILVAPGIYKPDLGGGNTLGDREATFQLFNGVTIKGGFAGFGEPNPDVWDTEAYETILSGDLEGDDGPDFSHYGDNSCHVVTGSYTDRTAVLDGFTIKAGCAYEGPPGGRGSPQQSCAHYAGAGMYNENGSPTVSNCIFTGNKGTRGAAMCNDADSSPTLTNSTFTSNEAYGDGGGIYNENSSPNLVNCTFSGNAVRATANGGGMYNRSSSPTLTECTFEGNSTWHGDGGGMYNDESSPTLNNCTFAGNSTGVGGDGGGMYNVGASPTLVECTFSENSSTGGGGGMYNDDDSSPTVTGCTFSENLAGGGGGGVYNRYSNPTVTNCTFRGHSGGASPTAMHSGGGMYNYGGSGESGTSQPGETIGYPTILNCEFTANIGGGMRNNNSSPTVRNCIFAGNATKYNGGGMVNKWWGSPTVTNCTFVGNLAGLSGGAMFSDSSVRLTVTNCIFWGNSPTQIDRFVIGSSTKAVYSDFQGGWPGEGNIDADPLFTNPGYWDLNGTVEDPNDDFWIDGDYHLKSQAGRWDPSSQSWVVDDVTSGCIDTGDPFSPICYEPFPNGSRINMGAYGGTQQASMSLHDPNHTSILGQASNPIPADEVADVNLYTKLSWTVGLNAVLHEVYFGASHLPPFVHSQTETEFYPNVLTPNTTYYWRIDELDDEGHRTIGDVWTFVTGPPPIQAYNPSPADGAVDVEIYVKFSWAAGLDSVSHDVYFGTSDLPPFVHNQTETEFDPGPLDGDTTYFWRIDEVNSGSKTTGEIWTFTTGSQPPPKGRTCFTGDTGVWVNGTLVPISRVRPGRNVAIIDSASTGSSSARPLCRGKVEEVQEHEGIFECYDVLLESGNCISVAECHYFLEEAGRWVALQNLKAGTRLQSPKGSIGIISVTKRPIPYVGKVYNLKVEGSDCYLVGEDAVIVRDY